MNKIIDPQRAIYEQLELLKNDKGIEILDATNPFTSLMEMSVRNTIDFTTSLELVHRKIMPASARTEEDILRHISVTDVDNLFTTPAKGYLRCLIPVNEIKDKAYYGDKSYKFALSKYSTITVDSINFTLLADIEVTLTELENGFVNSFVEHKVTDTTKEFKDIGVIPSFITQDGDNIDWLVFNVPVAQLTVSNYATTISRSIEYNVELQLNGEQYHSIELEYYDTSTGEYKLMDTLYTESQYLPTKPTAYVKVGETSINIVIPNRYIDLNLIGSEIRIILFTTRGKVKVFLDKYTTDDYKFKLVTVEATDLVSLANNLPILFTGSGVIDGGTNKSRIKDLKNKVIYRTAGHIDIPITEKQLFEKGRQYGLQIYKVTDSILERVYTATTDGINSNKVNNTFETPVYNIDTIIDTAEKDSFQDTIVHNDKYLCVNPYTLFHRDKNNIYRPISKVEASLYSSVDRTIANLLNERDILYTPYKYIINKDVNSLDVSIYDISNPKIDKLHILSKNTYINANVNIVSHEIFKINNNKYGIYFQLKGNDDYGIISENTKMAMRLKSAIDGNNIYLFSIRDMDKTLERYPSAEEPLHYFEIEVDNFIDKDNNINILNGVSEYNDKLINILSDIDIILYTDNNGVIGNIDTRAKNYSNQIELYFGEPKDYIVFTIESAELRLATRLKYLWNKTITVPNNRVYKKYTSDIPLLYDRDVYKLDPKTGCEVILEDTDGDGSCDNIRREIEHHAGDPVLDPNGNPILKYKAGDNILDENGDPILDTDNGYIYMPNILMFEYKFKVLNKPSYNEMLKNLMSLIEYNVNFKLSELNKVTINNTTILYKSRKDGLDVISSDGIRYPSIVKPIVTLYIDKLTTLEYRADELKRLIGNIINQYIIKKYIDITELEDRINDKIKGIIGCQIKDITPDNKKIITIANDSSRFSIATYINNEFDIVYNLEIQIEEINS